MLKGRASIGDYMFIHFMLFPCNTSKCGLMMAFRESCSSSWHIHSDHLWSSLMISDQSLIRFLSLPFWISPRNACNKQRQEDSSQALELKPMTAALKRNISLKVVGTWHSARILHKIAFGPLILLNASWVRVDNSWLAFAALCLAHWKDSWTLRYSHVFWILYE